MIDEKQHIARIDNLIIEMKQRDCLHLFCNGVGSQLTLLKWFRPPAWICKLFHAASVFHDVACRVGGTEEHKEVADEEFGVRSWKAVSHLGFFKRKYAMLWMNLDDDALKNFGGFSFEYRDAPCYDLDKLLLEVEC